MTISLSTLLRGFGSADWPSASLIDTFQADSGCHADLVNFYVGWETPFSDLQSSLAAVDANHSTALITWQPDGINTTQIANHTTYITQFADAVKAYGRPIFIRPAHEMNGNWYAWGIGDSSVNTHESYKVAFQLIVTIFRQEGATNASFLWSINNGNVGVGSSYTGAYPGDAYVDYVAIDGYNWGTTQSWSAWQSFSSVFTPAYQALTGLTTKNIILTEWASTETGGDKAAWITDAFQQITAGTFPQIAGLVWFNQQKETDWRIESSPAAQQAYAQANHG